LPVNLFASVMGTAGLSIAWRQASQAWQLSVHIAEAIGLLAFAIFAVLAVAYLYKAVKHPQLVLGEYRHPIAGNFFGTITIAMLLLSVVAVPFSARLAELLWIAGSAASIALSFAIAGRMLKGKVDTSHALPAWFIPGVATLDIVVAGGAISMPWAHQVELFAMAVGTMIALLFFTMIMSRMIHHDPLPAAMTPSLLIIMAPFEVGFLAYVQLTGHVDMFASLLFYFGLFLFLALAPKVFRKGVPFAAGWWATSFPMAALAIAALKYAAAVQAWPVSAIAAILLAVVTALVLVLLIRTLQALGNGKLLSA
jgi:tellurite resistance protein